jgi:hypothetical protein
MRGMLRKVEVCPLVLRMVVNFVRILVAKNHEVNPGRFHFVASFRTQTIDLVNFLV